MKSGSRPRRPARDCHYKGVYIHLSTGVEFYTCNTKRGLYMGTTFKGGNSHFLALQCRGYEAMLKEISGVIVTEATQFLAGLYAHSHMITDLRDCHQVTRMP